MVQPVQPDAQGAFVRGQQTESYASLYDQRVTDASSKVTEQLMQNTIRMLLDKSIGGLSWHTRQALVDVTNDTSPLEVLENQVLHCWLSSHQHVDLDDDQRVDLHWMFALLLVATPTGELAQIAQLSRQFIAHHQLNVSMQLVGRMAAKVCYISTHHCREILTDANLQRMRRMVEGINAHRTEVTNTVNRLEATDWDTIAARVMGWADSVSIPAHQNRQEMYAELNLHSPYDHNGPWHTQVGNRRPLPKAVATRFFARNSSCTTMEASNLITQLCLPTWEGAANPINLRVKRTLDRARLRILAFEQAQSSWVAIGGESPIMMGKFISCTPGNHVLRLRQGRAGIIPNTWHISPHIFPWEVFANLNSMGLSDQPVNLERKPLESIKLGFTGNLVPIGTYIEAFAGHWEQHQIEILMNVCHSREHTVDVASWQTTLALVLYREAVVHCNNVNAHQRVSIMLDRAIRDKSLYAQGMTPLITDQNFQDVLLDKGIYSSWATWPRMLAHILCICSEMRHPQPNLHDNTISTDDFTRGLDYNHLRNPDLNRPRQERLNRRDFIILYGPTTVCRDFDNFELFINYMNNVTEDDLRVARLREIDNDWITNALSNEFLDDTVRSIQGIHLQFNQLCDTWENFRALCLQQNLHQLLSEVQLRYGFPHANEGNNSRQKQAHVIYSKRPKPSGLFQQNGLTHQSSNKNIGLQLFANKQGGIHEGDVHLPTSVADLDEKPKAGDIQVNQKLIKSAAPSTKTRSPLKSSPTSGKSVRLNILE